MNLSVVIPAFNSQAFIGETLAAILAQTCKADHIVVVDDGSTDGTGEVVRQFSSAVTCLRLANAGQGAARKFAIERCDSDWIALCDSDDVWNLDFLERRRALLHAYPNAQFTFSDFYSFGPTSRPGHHLLADAPAGWLNRWCSIDPHGYYTVHDPYRAFLEFNPAYPSGIIFRRDAYLHMGGFLPKYSRWIAEDAEFVRRFLLLPNVRVVGDTAATWGYRRHEGNYSRIRWKNLHGRARILQEHLDTGIIPPPLRRDVSRTIDEALGLAFDAAYWENRQESAAAMYAILPRRQRTLKRRIKGVWVRLRNQLDRRRLS
ncbi:glycosyltransferase family 2 protein [uncultured Thiodictyon sp.]|jgi:glycosyltransferase involved in cell wall biosynthesis|uniref:glycosyltransferase family 2 protein n=1 Tax=uncultured Thiodictyon sp. TaxID=1846217 RepID=UPI0025D95628|nr:glycosyltransferase family 2 protein [uncultured Thiodictyon sp.]